MRATEAGKDSRKMVWAGRTLAVLTALFMMLDGVMKIVKPPQVLEANVRLGYPLSTLSGIGIALLACTLIYLIPGSWEPFCSPVIWAGQSPATFARAPGGSKRYSLCSSLPWFGAA